MEPDFIKTLGHEPYASARINTNDKYEILEMEMPKVGNLAVITDWDDNPACVIEVIRVEVSPFDEVDEKHAYNEGEGDRSLEYWRMVHWEAFSAVCEEMGTQPSEKMLVVREEFGVVHTAPHGRA